MLPLSHRRNYQEFLNALEDLHNSIESSQEQAEISIESFQQLQHQFQRKILALGYEGIDPDYIFQWRSLQTEVYRAWKLLEMEMMFFKSAQQGSTKARRVVQIRDRVKQLMGYCQGVLTHD